MIINDIWTIKCDSLHFWWCGNRRSVRDRRERRQFFIGNCVGRLSVHRVGLRSVPAHAAALNRAWRSATLLIVQACDR